jgi:hypothetical protein
VHGTLFSRPLQTPSAGNSGSRWWALLMHPMAKVALRYGRFLGARLRMVRHRTSWCVPDLPGGQAYGAGQEGTGLGVCGSLQWGTRLSGAGSHCQWGGTAMRRRPLTRMVRRLPQAATIGPARCGRATHRALRSDRLALRRAAGELHTGNHRYAAVALRPEPPPAATADRLLWLRPSLCRLLSQRRKGCAPTGFPGSPRRAPRCNRRLTPGAGGSVESSPSGTGVARRGNPEKRARCLASSPQTLRPSVCPPHVVSHGCGTAAQGGTRRRGARRAQCTREGRTRLRQNLSFVIIPSSRIIGL